MDTGAVQEASGMGAVQWASLLAMHLSQWINDHMAIPHILTMMLSSYMV